MKKLPQIIATVIPHKRQRYDTAGDYIYRKNKWELYISAMKDSDYEFMVLIHELLEMYLAHKRHIPERKITAFDLANINHPDPGRIKKAPYHREHMFAMKVERMLCKELERNWDKYDSSFEKLEYK
jgi:hypothetical protein